MCGWQFSIILSSQYSFDMSQLGGFTFISCLWWHLTNTSLGDCNFYFLPLSSPSPKSIQYTVHFTWHVRTNTVCYTLTLNLGFSVSIGLGGSLCLHVVLSWCCLSIRALLFQYAPNTSYPLVWRPNILKNKASSLWHSCYTFDHVCIKKLLYR